MPIPTLLLDLEKEASTLHLSLPPPWFPPSDIFIPVVRILIMMLVRLVVEAMCEPDLRNFACDYQSSNLLVGAWLSPRL